jgi:MFS family permease
MGAQIMFMLGPAYWVMVLARIIQGANATIVWTVGLALLCETTPESQIGQQIGLAMTGLSVGIVLAPPLGGVLYSQLGFHAPFILTLGVLVLDLVLRLLVIERKDAVRWGVDPALIHIGSPVDDIIDTSPSSTQSPIETKPGARPILDTPENPLQKSILSDVDNENANKENQSMASSVPPQPIRLNLIQVMGTMLRSRRALAASINAFIFA